MNTGIRVLVGLCSVVSLASCGDDVQGGGDDPGCQGGKCDNDENDPEDGPAKSCGELITDFSGRGLAPEDIKGHNDPIAQFVLNGQSTLCSMSVADIVEELAPHCEQGSLGTQFVSERSQLLGVFTDYRAVTELQCGGRKVFLHYPILAEAVTENGNPGENIDPAKLVAQLDQTFPAIIGEDESGVFNFYQARNRVERVCLPRGAFLDEDGLELPDDLASCETTEECDAGEECRARPDEVGQVADFRFFGNSMDFVDLPDRAATLEAMATAIPGPVVTEADVDHSLDVVRNCAVCHPNGGITFRELFSPWVHWEAGGHFSSPQTAELVSSAPDILGQRLDGIDFEGTVVTANENYLETRLEMTLGRMSQGEMSTGDLLRPLFCTDEFNIGTLAQSPGDEVRGLPLFNVVIDGRIDNTSGDLDIDDAVFAKRRSAVQPGEAADEERKDWRLWGFSVGPFAGLLNVLGLSTPRETLGEVTFIHRAEIDSAWERLLTTGPNFAQPDNFIISSEFVSDVLLVDFTRSVFSEERCELLDVVDRVDPSVFLDGDRPRSDAADRLTAAVIAELESDSDRSAAEADFLANLKADGPDPFDMTREFDQQCRTRPADQMTADYLDYVAQTRKRAAHQETAMGHEEAAFMMFRFPGANGFFMPDAMAQSFVHGLRFDPASCTLINHYPDSDPLVTEPEPPPAPQDPGALSCQVRGCTFDAALPCQCDKTCLFSGECCDFDGNPNNNSFEDDSEAIRNRGPHDGPSHACDQP